MFRRTTTAALTAAGALILAACGQTTTAAESGDPETKASAGCEGVATSTGPVSLTDSYGNKIELDKPAERVINADPDAWYAATAEHMGEDAYADLRRALHDPEVVHAMLEDYRAGLREDRDHDADDRAAGRRITSPLLVISLLQDDPDLDYGTPTQPAGNARPEHDPRTS